MIDTAFTKVYRLFLLSFGKNAEGNHRHSLPHYKISNVEIKDFNFLIDGSFFDLSVKNEEEAYKKIIEMSRNNDYTTGNLFGLLIWERITN